MAKPVTEYVISAHAREQMQRRGIEETIVRRILLGPEQRREVRPGRDVLQSQIDMGGRNYLVRVFVDVDRKPAIVVSTYRTSKLEKYWRASP